MFFESIFIEEPVISFFIFQVMIEFTITFRLRDKTYKASVLRKKGAQKIEFDVRPRSPMIVREFGHQIRIFKKSDKYHTPSPIAKGHYMDLFDCLVEALREYDQNNLKRLKKC